MRLDVGPKGRLAVIVGFALFVVLKFGWDLLAWRRAEVALDGPAVARAESSLIADIIVTSLIVIVLLILIVPARLRLRHVRRAAGEDAVVFIGRPNAEFRTLVVMSSRLMSFTDGDTSPRLGLTATLEATPGELGVWARRTKVAAFSSPTLRVVPRVEATREFFGLDLMADDGSSCQIVIVDSATTLFPLSKAELAALVQSTGLDRPPGTG